LDDLHVHEDDYQFADTVGRPQPFGSAGDCYSDSGNCPQGDFSINLKDTGFRIKPKQEWELHGTFAVMNYVIEVSI
jgi:a disintegrin and metalloproteinase with thrombospondin motifs 9